MNRDQGFSLVEVLVALMIVGIALPAMLGQMQSQGDAQAILRNKTLAMYVAQNKMAEYRIAKKNGAGKLSNSENGEIESGGALWYWVMTSEQAAPMGDIKSQYVTVSVGLEPEESLSAIKAVMVE